MRQVRVSGHNHLRTSSYITRSDAKKAIDIAAERLGPGGVFGVIQFNPSPYEIDARWERFVTNLPYDKIHTKNGVYIPEKDVLAFRGQEVPTQEGLHVLIYGAAPHLNFDNGLSLDKILTLAEAWGVPVIADHPFHMHGTGTLLDSSKELRSRFSGYEVWNGIAIDFKGYKEANRKAQETFDKYKAEGERNLFPVISDDGHSIPELGRSWQEISMPNDYTVAFRDSPQALTNALISGHHATEKEQLASRRTLAPWGFYNHALDIAVAILAGKFSLDTNKHIAPALQKIGISL